MDAPTKSSAIRINRWLPYWAVFQSDVRQTLRGWMYRVWVLVLVIGSVGYLLYRVGVDREAGILQSASLFLSDLLRWTVLGSVAPIIALAGGSISSERGIMADSVLSRGISRYQYFLGKWHARLVIVAGTFLFMGSATLTACFFLLQRDIQIFSSLLALVTLVVLMAVVTTCGVTASAIANSTVLGVGILGMTLYGLGFALTLLPARFPTPDYVLTNLPSILRGSYSFSVLGEIMSWSAGGSLCVALVGLLYFGRRDV